MTTPAQIPTIDASGIYDDALLCELLGVSLMTLARARKDGTLRHTIKGKRTLYLGEWVTTWLRDRSKGVADGQ